MSTDPTPAAAPTPKGLLLKADPIAAIFQDEVKTTLASRGSSSLRPRLVGILSTSSEPSKMYAEFTRKQCEALGVDFVLKKTGAALEGGKGFAEGEGVEEAIMEANEDPSVDGIMVYFPIFGPRQDQYLQQLVSPYKDVEGLHVKFHFNLYHNIRFISPESLAAPSSSSGSTTTENDQPPPGTVKSIIPCTPLAIVKCLEHVGVYNKILPYGDRAYGKTVCVVNRSEVVGRPLAALLANDGARVFSVDIDSIQEYTKRPSSTETPSRKYYPSHVVRPTNNLTLEDCLVLSDVVISAVPKDDYKIKTAWLKDGCVCVNVAAEKNFEKDVREKASLYIPAVGKVTILMLLRNLLRLQQYRNLA
ncbi:NAD-P-binding protein [Dendrothele bispora CBS 962.96]|uniref:NAD-P-binding protein n=1 Tax=Dendrothele bispora (strain CBS 962.96) TaxID=1314807 RepID=A0A4S8MYH2_DENBC|nr:NAD-P-binding protein [Dendrothele bispora CBS 962.96]